MAPIPIVTGPTAVGKTAVAVELAERLDAEIICADARQIYRGLRVGSAQPGAEERRRVPHHLLDFADPLALYTAADFARDGRRVLAELARRRVRAVVAGGSGLYLRALVHGLFAGPGRDRALRRQLAERAEREGDGALHAELEQIDPQTAARLHPRDRVRVIRALEVHHLTGKVLSEHHREHGGQGTQPPLAARTFVLDRDREDLRQRIDARTRAMFDGGLLEEARALLDRGLAPEHPAYRTLGYEQAFAHLRGEIGRDEAIERAQRATRQYARRQLTWFRSLADATWLTVGRDEPPATVAGRIRVGCD